MNLLSNEDYKKITGKSFYSVWVKPFLEKRAKTNARKNNKKTISETLKWMVLERDNFTCKHCGSRKFLSIDHVIPESKGGETKIENLQTLCRSCNSKKGAKYE